MEYVRKSSLWIDIFEPELHNDQSYYWPTIYRAGAAVVSTIQWLFLEPEWAIDSEAVRERGIIALVKSK